MAPRSIWSALPLFLLLAPALAVENDFSFYPSGARSCLYDSADAAGCTSGTISALNTCLCGNNNDFVINTAKCLGEKDSGDVDSVYDTMSEACSGSSTPLSVSKSDFQDAASGASSGTTTAADSSSTEAASSTQAASSATDDSATTTSTAVATQSAYTTTVGGSTVTVIPTQTQTSSSGSGSSNSNDNSSGLSTTATIGVGVGAAVAGAGLVGAIVFFVLRRRRGRDEEQAQGMLLQNQQGTPQNPSPFAPPPHSMTPAMTFSSDAQSQSNWTGGTSPSPAPTGWGKPEGVSPQYPQYNTPGQVHLAPGAPPMQQVQPQVFEMDSSQTVVVPPVEMPGSAVQR